MGEAACLPNLAYALDHKGDHTEAERRTRVAMDLYADMSAALRVADRNLSLAYTLTAQGRPEEAAVAANAARDAYLGADQEWDEEWHRQFVSDIHAGCVAAHSHSLKDGDVSPATPEQPCPLCGSQAVQRLTAMSIQAFATAGGSAKPVGPASDHWSLKCGTTAENPQLGAKPSQENG